MREDEGERSLQGHPRKPHNYYVYIMASQTRVLYIGVTNDLERRVEQHKNGLVPGFTSKYRVRRLVYFEETSDIHAALTRGRQLKGWTRAKKVTFIKSVNPEWSDLGGAQA
jgi:putative endonuclease